MVLDTRPIYEGEPAIYAFYNAGSNIDVTVDLKECELEFNPQFCAGALFRIIIPNRKISGDWQKIYWWANFTKDDEDGMKIEIPVSLSYVEYEKLNQWIIAIVEMLNTITGEPK